MPQMSESWHVPGWVGPIAAVTNTSTLYRRTRLVIDALSARILSLKQARDTHTTVEAAAAAAAAVRPNAGAHDTYPTVNTAAAAAAAAAAACVRPSSAGASGGSRSHGHGGDRRTGVHPHAPGLAFLEAQLSLLMRRRKALSHHLLARIQVRHTYVTNKSLIYYVDNIIRVPYVGI